jgi:predicted TIM-barrel fold metal-dependent hydrolase
MAAALPVGACDCHVHVVGPQADYPMDAGRHYTPGPASCDALLSHMDQMGLSRAVIVQPSIYGTDNRCTLDGLARMAGAGRGIAVVDEDISDADLQALDRGWMRGLRINLESTGSSSPEAVRDALTYWADRVASLGWHLQVYASLDALAASASVLRALPVPVVLDHFAMIPAGLSLDDVRVRAVFDLVGSGAAYVKLSGTYRIEPPEGAAQATQALARAFIACNPERMLWASDWPHTNREPGKGPLEVSAYRNIGRERLRREIDTWFGTPEVLNQVLVENPARLYGF